jgi:hypothetical protein
MENKLLLLMRDGFLWNQPVENMIPALMFSVYP